MKLNSTYCRFLILLLLCLLLVSETSGQDVNANWTAIKTAFQKFVEYPSGENASYVISLLPEKHVEYTDSSKEQETIDYIFDADNFGMLERQVISRNREAVRLSFRLHSIADGHFTEELNIMLGTLIRIDPKLFLEELSLANPDDNLWTDLLCNFGPEFVDRFNAKILEIKLRIDALKSVEDTTLIKIRDKCINIYLGFESLTKAQNPDKPKDQQLQDAIIKALVELAKEWDKETNSETYWTEIYNRQNFKFVSREFDLNDDGNKELIVWIPTQELGGTSGYPIIIFAHTENGYQKLWGVEQAWTPIIVLETKNRGWRDIAFQFGGGGVDWFYQTLRFNGKIYAYSKSKKQQPKGQIVIDKDFETTLFGPMLK